LLYLSTLHDIHDAIGPDALGQLCHQLGGVWVLLGRLQDVGVTGHNTSDVRIERVGIGLKKYITQ
jgi:hypothetical protein